ncbi:hypothetical protein GH714_012740 [Hevea brasiliensis]|uniref:Protein kinase domain-containing protein n=1 Tax=Hevea brasiliensis TaxID=3981 RepID=A0A6A6ML32_HEVBR|nr:hypothetical protein GH714_012740 [Hevea brasiliensis]
MWAGGNSVPFYKDYVVWIPNGSQSKQDLWVALHPYMEQKPEHANAFLNGLEIFKLNNSGGSLAGSNPEPVSASPEQHPVPKIMKHKGSLQVVVVIGVVFGGTFALSSILWMAEIRASTRNFDDENVIGSGGFGTVYKGYIENGSIPVAIKRLDSSSRQGIREFRTEIEMAPVISYLPKEQVNLIDWARNCYRTGTLDQIIDPQLKGDIAPVSSNKFAEIAESCVRDQAIERPTMGDVVWSLEFALQLQETAEKNVNTGDILSYSQKGSFVHEMITSDDKALLPKAENDDEVFTCKFSSSQKSASSSAVSTGERSSGNYDSDRVRSGAVFSELMNPHGR